MGGEPKLANEGVKEFSPFGIVGLKETKFDGNMMADIDGLQDGGGGRLDDGVAAIGGLRGGIVTGEVAVDQRVDIVHDDEGRAVEEREGRRRGKRARQGGEDQS
jgi:hypothetical protein